MAPPRDENPGQAKTSHIYVVFRGKNALFSLLPPAPDRDPARIVISEDHGYDESTSNFHEMEILAPPRDENPGKAKTNHIYVVFLGKNALFSLPPCTPSKAKRNHIYIVLLGKNALFSLPPRIPRPNPTRIMHLTNI